MNAQQSIAHRHAAWLAGPLMIAVPAGFMVFFTLLQVRFDYPDILREPPAEVLTRFAAARDSLLPLWFGMFASALAFIMLAVLVPAQLPPARRSGVGLLVTGVLAGLVQAIGLSRWVFVVPGLAETFADPATSAASRDAIIVTFTTINRLFGVGIGEFMGYLFTGIWTLLVAHRLWTAHRALASVGAACAAAIFCGLLEPTGLAPWSGAVNALGYTAWSIWLAALGVSVMIRR